MGGSFHPHYLCPSIFASSTPLPHFLVFFHLFPSRHYGVAELKGPWRFGTCSKGAITGTRCGELVPAAIKIAWGPLRSRVQFMWSSTVLRI